jgi:hypothetical protein
LSCRVHNRLWSNLRDELQNSFAITDVKFVMRETPQRLREPTLVPPGITRRPKENRSLIVIDAMHVPSESVEVSCHFAANKARGASD